MKGLLRPCRNWILNISLVVQPLYGSLKQDQPEPLCWEIEHSEATENHFEASWERSQSWGIQIMTYLFFLVLLAVWLVGSYFPDQRLNPGPGHWEC